VNETQDQKEKDARANRGDKTNAGRESSEQEKARTEKARDLVEAGKAKSQRLQELISQKRPGLFKKEDQTK
jgi:hypothetical protein